MTIKGAVSGWDQLLCGYFRDACIEVVGAFFKQKHFLWRETDIGGMVFFRENYFIELSYVPETYPAYSPTIIVGMGASKFSDGGEVNGVPLWYVLPEGTPQKAYSIWRFRDKKELTVVLEKIRLEIIDVYVMPLLQDESKLARLIEEFSRRV
jgi:hypothetical protein